MKSNPFYLIMLIILSAFTFSCGVTNTGHGPMKLNYFEYTRGVSSHSSSDIRIQYEDNDYTFEDVKLVDKSFFPDDSIFPNAFIKPLIKFEFNDALKAFTEPYYSYRFIRFLKSNPHIGIGIEFIHLKVFIDNFDQQLNMTGTVGGSPVNGTRRIGDFLSMYNVSHGVNHLGLHAVYRWMLNKGERFTDGRIQPYINFSIGPAIPHLEIDLLEAGVPKRRAYSYQSGFKNWGIAAGTGVRYKFSKYFGMFLEYKMTYSHLHDMYLDDLRDNSNVSMDFWVHHLQWGLSFNF